MAEGARLIMLSAPSGAGKTTLVRALLRCRPDIALSISATTRPARAGEKDGVDYYFLNETRFAARVAAGDMLEMAHVFGHDYGTPREAVQQHLDGGRDVLLEIDWQGARQVRRHYPTALWIFILPPSRSSLEQRLQQRGKDSAEVIAHRMARAEAEMSHYHEADYVLVNRELEGTIADLEAILRAESKRAAAFSDHEQELFGELQRMTTEDSGWILDSEQAERLMATIRWDAAGLLPVLACAVDSGQPLMQAWMNRDALAATLRGGEVVYWSRSRQRLWRKGEQSGHIQQLCSIQLDCDGDSLLLRVRQLGGIACHSGRRSCYYRRWEKDQWQIVEPVLRHPDDIYGG